MPETAAHLIRSYDEELARLHGLVGEMGSLVQSQLASAVAATLCRDPTAATQVVEADSKVDVLEREVEQFAIRLLALRQPVARDLRQIIGALKMSDDLERIGDYAANIAKRVIILAQTPLSFSLAGLAQMAELVQQNLRCTVEAYAAADARAAAAVWRADQAADEAYNMLFRELITYMLEDTRDITACTHLLFIARNLERIGDHATNLAESIYYAAQGRALAGPRPKGADADAIHATEGV